MSELSSEFLELQVALAGDYSLERELGRGGMGIVLLARDVQLDRYVAIKVLAPHLTADPIARARFLREARTAAGLSHPNIVPIHRVGEMAGFVFFVMSYVPGETLGERLRARGPLTNAEAIRLVREVAWALAYAHGRGVIHRDVKPDNILLEADTGRALVTDFGIAHVGSTTLSSDPGLIVGTAQFMSPEQAMSNPVDGRSDLYSLGVVAYAAVSGRLPFEAANLPALLMQQVSAAPPPVARNAPGTVPALASAIHRCLEKEPANRFANGEELAAALAPASENRPALPAPLRNWLAERNPATVFFAVWSGLMGIPIFYDLTQVINYTSHSRAYLFDLVQMSILAAAPIAPVIGYHAKRARRLFQSGFTVEDLRGALDVAEQEKKETEKLDPKTELRPMRHALRLVTYSTISTTAVLTFLSDVVHFALERRHIVFPLRLYQTITLVGWIASLALLVIMNMNQIPIIPEAVRRFFRGGLRDKLWRSKLGEWLAKRLGAPSVSRPLVAGIFQPTEVALGGAASDLYRELPSAFRDHLTSLPSIVHELEDRARRARSELDALNRGQGEAGMMDNAIEERRAVARDQLTRSVAALESIRVDLLRLRAGATDLSSLTTLLERAQSLGEELGRLDAAQREVRSLLLPQEDGLRERTPV